MASTRFSVGADEVTQRVKLRLAGAAQGGAARPAVAWGDERGSIVLQLSSLKTRLTDGWLLVSLDAHAPGATASTLQFLYFLGRDGNGEDATAGGTVTTGDAAGAALVETWGSAIQRVVWDGVLDVIEGVVNYAGQKTQGRALAITGFVSTEGTLQVDLQINDAG